MTTDELRVEYERLQEEGTRLAGGLTDLAQRATVYHGVYRESGGNHVFPLIAAHGALWAGGWFKFGFRLAHGLAWQNPLNVAKRQWKMEALGKFADAFREINRRVCVDTHANFHFTRLHGTEPDAAVILPATLLEAVNRVHVANSCDCPLTDAHKREIFQAHFLYEQEHIVGPIIERAAEQFDWPLLKLIAMRPVVSFAYLPRGLWFRNFASRDERIANGLKAFDMAAQVGWPRVESALREYGLLPERFFQTSLLFRPAAA